MIIVKSRGQLGNQMFQYAFAYSLSKILKTFFVIEKIDCEDKLYYFKRLDQDYSFFTVLSYFLYSIKMLVHSRLYNSIISLLIFFRKSRIQDIMENNFENPQINTENNKKYIGYFQSSQYFENSSDSIKFIFSIKEKYKKWFSECYHNIFARNNILIIHVRYKDYINSGNDYLGGENLSLPFSYYENCLTQIKNLHNYKIFILSDDIEMAKNNLGSLNATFVNNHEIVDFQMIQNADIAIIANSTFAWWAAWLNPKPGKIIYVPQFWLGFKVSKEFPVGIYTKEFIEVKF